MPSLTLRLPDDLLEHCKQAAALEQLSLNGWTVMVLRSAVDPDYEPDPKARMREKLRRAGLLFQPTPRPPRPRVPPEVLEKAGRELGKGKLSSEYVSEGRGPY